VTQPKGNHIIKQKHERRPQKKKGRKGEKRKECGQLCATMSSVHARHFLHRRDRRARRVLFDELQSPSLELENGTAANNIGGDQIDYLHESLKGGEKKKRAGD